jgi:hypothetical protein
VSSGNTIANGPTGVVRTSTGGASRDSAGVRTNRSFAPSNARHSGKRVAASALSSMPFNFLLNSKI